MTAADLTAIAALIAAIGGVAATIFAWWARRAAMTVKDRLVVVDGKLYSLEKRIDGRLSELLKAETGKARAEGITAGEQSQRDRDSVSPEMNGGLLP